MNNRPQPADLYLTYNCNRHILHANLSDEGLSGFLRYMRDDMLHIMQQGHDYDTWLTYYHFSDRRGIPDLRHAAESNYFDLVTRAAKENAAKCRYTVKVRDALYCISKGITPLTPPSQPMELSKQPDYPTIPTFGDNLPLQKVILPEYRAIQALETKEGTMLFSYTPEGERQRKEYENYIERNFFDPTQPEGKLRYWEIIANTAQVMEAVDRLPKGDQVNEPGKLNEAYFRADLHSYGRIIKEYDLVRNGENYEVFHRRNEEEHSPKKKILDMTLTEIWQQISNPLNRDNRNVLQCMDVQNFPGEQSESQFKISR